MSVKELIEKLSLEFEDTRELYRYYAREYGERASDLISNRSCCFEAFCNDKKLNELATQTEQAYSKMNVLRIALTAIIERAT